MTSNTIKINGTDIFVEEFERISGQRVEHVLDLTDIKIRGLPAGLVVMGDLILCGTGITDFPDDILVYGNIYYPAGIPDEQIERLKKRISLEKIKLASGLPVTDDFLFKCRS